MPWDAFKRGDEYCVYKLDEDKKPTGDTLGCHPSEDKAKAQLRALYASENNKAMVTLLDSQTDKAYIAPKPVSLWKRRQTGLTVWKGDDGRRYLFIVTSNSYEDREQETITTKALQRYVDKAWAVDDHCIPDNELQFWHEGEPIGDIVWADMEGPFLLEVAKERKDRLIRVSKTRRARISQIWDGIEQKRYRWGASHGFKYPESKKRNGTYTEIYKFETSILPLDMAANPYTFAGVIDDMNRDNVLNDLLGVPEAARKFRKGVQAVKRELDKQGLQHKAVTETKGIMENLGTAIDAFLTKVTDKPDPTLKDQLMQAIVGAMTAATPEGEPDGDEAVEYDEMEPDGDEATTDSDEKKPTAADLTSKQIKLLDRLLTSQEQIANDSAEQQKAITTVAEAVAALLPLVDASKSYEARLKKIEETLNGKPRRASVDPETVVADEELTKAARELAARTEPLFPGSNIQVRKD